MTEEEIRKLDDYDLADKVEKLPNHSPEFHNCLKELLGRFRAIVRRRNQISETFYGMRHPLDMD